MKQYSMPYNVFKTITSNFFICVSIIMCAVFLSVNLKAQTYTAVFISNATKINDVTSCGSNYYISFVTTQYQTASIAISDAGTWLDASNTTITINAERFTSMTWYGPASSNVAWLFQYNPNSSLDADRTFYLKIIKNGTNNYSMEITSTPPLCGTPAVALATNAVSVANIGQSSINNVVRSFTLTTTTADATLNAVSFNNTGNAVYSTDVTNYKLYYTATSGTFSTGTLLKIITTGTSFTGLTQSLPVGGPYYFWITADVESAATAGSTITIGAMADTDFTIASGNKSGSAAASGTQTITAPSVTISSGAAVAAANVGQNATNHIVSTIAMSVTDAATTVNSIAFSNTGTANYTNDITNYKLYYTGTANSFSTNTLLGTITTGTSFTGLTQSLPVGGPYYFWITADVTSTATVGKTITVSQINSTNITFASGSKSGNNAAAGTQTIIATEPAITLADNTVVPSGNIYVNTTNNIVSRFKIDVTGNTATATAVAFSTIGDAVTTTDLTNFKLWHHTANNFGSASTVSTITTGLGAGSHSFSGFTQSLPVGTHYFWITTDIPSGATNNRTLTVSALSSSDITIASGTKSGSASASGTQTIMTAVPKNYYFVGNSDYNWNDPNAWRVGSCSGSIDGYPGSNDNVYFICNQDNKVITLNDDAACASLTINKNGQKINLTNYNLTVGGDVAIKSQHSSIYSSVGTSNTLHIGGNLSLEKENTKIEAPNHTIIIDGNLSLSGGPSRIESAKSISVGGNLTISGHNDSYVKSTGNISVLGNVSLTQQKALIRCANLDITNNLTLSANECNVETTGPISCATMTLLGQGTRVKGTTTTITGDLTISGGNNSYVQPLGDMFINGNVRLTEQNVEIKMSSYNLTIGGTFENTKNDVKGITWTTGTVSIHGDIIVVSNNATERPFNCTGTGWLELTGGISQTFTTNNNISIKRFRQSNTGFTKAGGSTLTISNIFDQNCGPLKPADVTVSIPANTINTECNNPTLNVSQASLSGFLYCHGSGPSAYQTIKVSGENLTNNVVVTAPENYEISTTSDFADVSPITLTVVDGEVQNQPETLYVRLKSGLDAGNYNENITLTSTDANTVQVSCSGAVSNTPIITLNTATLSGFSYYVPDGPSASQYYTVAGSCLTENIVATPLANYEVSLNNTAFSSSVTLTPTNGMVQATKVYVRLRAGLVAANYNETITHTSSGAVQKDIACSGSVITPAMLAFSSLSQIGVGDIHKQDKDRILSTFQVEVTVASAELLSIPFTTSGTHTANDIKSYALWVNDANTGFAYAKRCGGKIFTTTGAGTHIFDNIEYTFAPGTTYYMWITADVATDAVTGNTVQVDAIDVAHISLTNGAKSGTISAAGLQTIVPTAQLTEFMYIVTQGPSKYQTFSIASSSLSGDGSITVTVPNSFYEISKSPSGDYTNTLTYNYTNGVLAPAAGIVYVRLKQGLSVGEYTETITINGGGYTNTVNCSGGVGQVYYAKNDNLNWNDASSWSLSCGGSDAGSIPTYKDSAVIGCDSGSDNWFEDNTFSLGGNVVVGGIKIDRKATLALVDFNLRVKNDVQIGITNTWADGQGAINVGDGTLIVENNLTLGYNNDKHGLKWDAGNIYIGGNLICADGGGPLPLIPGTDEHQNRSLRPGGGTESDESFVVNIPSYTGAIIMTGEQKSIQVSALAVDLVRVKLESNTISKTGAGILYITEEFNFNGVTSFTNSEGTTVITGDILYANSATLENKAKLEIGTLKNNINMHNAAVGSHTEYFLSGAEPVNHGSYYDLTISGGGVKTLMGDIEVQNKLHFPVSGYLDLNGHNLTMKNWQNGNIYPITSADRYVISNNGTFTIEGVDNGETANFPIGLSPADEDYCRVDITNNSGTHTFTIDGVCNALYSNGTCDGAGGGVKATHQAVGLTWFISSLSNNADITLYWHPSKHLPAFNEDNAILSHYGSQWSKPEDAISIQSFAGNFKTITGNATSFSPFSVQNSEGLLPIELLWFRAKKRAEGTLLEWETATEINNDYFTLHRSYNGVFFNPLSTISGAGNSSYNTKYSYIDTEKLYGTTYYQLSQTDYDGAVSYSHVVSTYTELPTFELLSYKQQGGVSQFELLFAEYESDNHCKIVSTLGAVLHEQVFTNSAYELIEIALKPGVYTLLNTVEGHTYSIKVVVR